jgi:hypothetical protein
MRLRNLAAQVALLACLSGAPSLAQPVSTDGTNRQSPVKVVSVTLVDTTPDSYYLSGSGSGVDPDEVRVTAVIKNTSSKSLSNVAIHVQIYDLTGKLLKEYVKNLDILTPDETYEYAAPGYENVSLALVQAKVVVTHDKQVLGSQENQGQGTPPSGDPIQNEQTNPNSGVPKYNEPKDKDGPPGY